MLNLPLPLESWVRDFLFQDMDPGRILFFWLLLKVPSALKMGYWLKHVETIKAVN